MEEHPQARFIIDTLRKEGFEAYYAGGFVRDLLLGHPSDDIDIATNALPKTIQALFPHTVPIGIAFGIVLVIVEHRQYEVATFRQDLDYKDGRRPTQIQFTSAEEDAKRRDFTINGMFFDPLEKKVLDFVGGKEDLEKKLIRAIGNPHLRIKEDRLRMMRAVRLACRFDFTIDPDTEKAIEAHAKELFPAVAIERIWQEFTKAHAFGSLKKMVIYLQKLGLLPSVFPPLAGISPKEVEKRLKPTEHYNKSTPLIAFFLPLFPNLSLEKQLDLCKKLKLPKIDLVFVRTLFHFKELCFSSPNVELYDLAKSYASPFFKICLEVLFSKGEKAYQEHEMRYKKIESFVYRIINKTPVVTSSHLAAIGIKPGKGMGELLKEAEKISINELIESPERIIEKLKSSSIWPKD